MTKPLYLICLALFLLVRTQTDQMTNEGMATLIEFVLLVMSPMSLYGYLREIIENKEKE